MAKQPELGAEKLAELIRIDQCERCRLGRLPKAEEYFAAFPDLHTNQDLAIDIVYQEYLLREQSGEQPRTTEYNARFPQYCEVLADQIGLHAALVPSSDDGGPASTLIGDTPATGSIAPRFKELPIHFGRYGVLKLIGRGGMGDVYLAENALLDRRVALKLPRFRSRPNWRSAVAISP